MKAHEGYSAEYSRWRFDVDVDEMDLRRILYAAGWSGRRDRIPAALAFKLLETEAQILMYHTIATKFDYPADEAKEKIQMALAEQKAAMAKLMDLPIPEPSPFEEEPVVD